MTLARNRSIVALVLAAALAFMPSCASIPREVVIRSNTAIRVSEGGRAVAAGNPVTVSLDVDRDHLLLVEAEGREPQTLKLVSQVSALRVVVSVCLTLFLPIIILPVIYPTWIAQGYWYDFEPAEPVVTFGAVGQAGDDGARAREEARARQGQESRAREEARSRQEREARAREAARARQEQESRAREEARAQREQEERARAAPPARPSPASARFCGECGTAFEKGTRFCGSCGAAAK